MKKALFVSSAFLAADSDSWWWTGLDVPEMILVLVGGQGILEMILILMGDEDNLEMIWS